MKAYYCLYGIIIAMFTMEHLIYKREGVLLQIHRKRMIALTWISVIALALMVGFRALNMGQDLPGYFFYCDIIKKDSWMVFYEHWKNQRYANFELGFCFMAKILSSICDNHQILLVGSAFAFILPLGYYICRCSSNYLVSILAFLALPYFTTMFSAIRQSMAIGIMMLAFVALKGNKTISYFILITVASLFHKSAIFMIVLYLAYRVRMSRSTMLIVGIGSSMAFYVLKRPIFYVLIRLVKPERSAFEINNSGGLFLGLVMLYIMCVCLCDMTNDVVRGFTNLLLVACLMQSLSSLHNLVGRMTWYPMLSVIVLAPEMLRNISWKTRYGKEIATIAMCAILVVGGLYFISNEANGSAVPYVPCWRYVAE